MYHTSQEHVDSFAPQKYIKKWNGKDRNFINAATYDIAWWLQETELGQSFAPWTYEVEQMHRFYTLFPWVAEMWRMSTTPYEFNARVGSMIQHDIIATTQTRLDVWASHGVNSGNDLVACAMQNLIYTIANRHVLSSSDMIWWHVIADALFSDLSKQELLEPRLFERNPEA